MQRISTIIVIFTCCFLSACVYADDNVCFSHMTATHSTLLSLKSIIATQNTDRMSLLSNSLLTIAAGINNACSGMPISFRPPKNIEYTGSCQESLDYITEILSQLYNPESTISVLQQTINFLPRFEETCLNDSEFIDEEVTLKDLVTEESSKRNFRVVLENENHNKKEQVQLVSIFDDTDIDSDLDLGLNLDFDNDNDDCY